MFSTYFYIFILFYQLFISEKSGVYNNKIVRINELIANFHYQDAYSEILTIEKYSLFNNPKLDETKVLLGIKLNRGMKQHLINSNLDIYQKTIILSKLGLNKQSIHNLRREIILGSNDSLIKMFEIYSINKNYHQLRKRTKLNKSKSSKMGNSDALALLNLMKKKEKFLQYNYDVR